MRDVQLADIVAKNIPALRVQNPFIFLLQKPSSQIIALLFHINLVYLVLRLTSTHMKWKTELTDSSASIMGPVFLVYDRNHISYSLVPFLHLVF